MSRYDDIFRTIEMLQSEHLDVRAVNMGIDLFDCADRDIDKACRLVKEKIIRCASPLLGACKKISRRYGIPIVNKRVAISPIADVMAGHDVNALIQLAHSLDEAAEQAGIDFIGGYSALVHKGMTSADRALIESLPEVLSQTKRICASVNAASTRAGINVEALLLIGRILREIAAKTADADGFGCCKLSTFSNIPEDNPFMAGAYKGIGEPETVINIGVSGPGVVKRAIEKFCKSGCCGGLGDIAEQIKSTAFRVTR